MPQSARRPDVDSARFERRTGGPCNVRCLAAERVSLCAGQRGLSTREIGFTTPAGVSAPLANRLRRLHATCRWMLRGHHENDVDADRCADVDCSSDRLLETRSSACLRGGQSGLGRFGRIRRTSRLPTSSSVRFTWPTASRLWSPRSFSWLPPRVERLELCVDAAAKIRRSHSARQSVGRPRRERLRSRTLPVAVSVVTARAGQQRQSEHESKKVAQAAFTDLLSGRAAETWRNAALLSAAVLLVVHAAQVCFDRCVFGRRTWRQQPVPTKRQPVN